MKLLVTGGAGYVGSVCAAHLVAPATRWSCSTTCRPATATRCPTEARFVEADLAEAADEVLAEGFDGVLHFAAVPGRGESVQRPELYWRGNVVTAIGLLDAMRRHGTPRLVFSSTAATYGEPEQVPIREDAPTRPTNPYGASKLAIDHAIGSYARAHGLAADAACATSTWPVRTAGSASATPWRPTSSRSCCRWRPGSGRAPQIFGDDWPTPDGTCVRDYIHVDDLAAAHLLALAHAVPGEHAIYNLGSGSGFSVREVVEACRTGDRAPHPGERRAPPRPATPPCSWPPARRRARRWVGARRRRTC